MATRDGYWTSHGPAWRASRRTALRSAAGVSAFLAATLVGCSSSNNNNSATRAAGTTSAPAGSPAAGGAPPSAAAGSPAPRPAGTPAAVAAKRGGTVTNAIGSDPTSLDPHTGTGGNDHQNLYTMFDTLVGYDARGNLDPSLSLAQSWQISDPMTIVLKLRTGVKFHDGTDFNAAVAKYNLQRVADPKTKSVAASTIASIDTIDTPDPATVVLHLKNPDASLLANLGDRAGFTVSQAAADKFGLTDFSRNPVGTGPFKFVEWAQTDHITVARNDQYWGKDAAGGALPYLDKVSWKIIPDATVATASLESGDSDIANLLSQDQQRLGSSGKYTLASFQGSTWRGINVNMALPPLNDLRVRQALAYAIDRQSFVNAGIYGKEIAGGGPITPAQWAYDPTINVPGYDPAKAQSLLAAAGITGRLKISTAVIATSTLEQESQLYQQMLAKVGIDADLQNLQAAAWVSTLFTDRTLPMGFNSFGLRVDPDGVIGLLFQSDSFYNAGHVANPDLDSLIKSGRTTYDQNQRKQIYKQIQEAVANQVYDVFVCFDVPVTAARTPVQGMDTYYGGEGKPRFKWLWRTS